MKRHFAVIAYLLVTGGILWSDLWTKEEVFRHLLCEVWWDEDAAEPRMTMSNTKPIIPGWLDLECALNRGAFNGWFRSHTEILAAVSIAAVLIITLILAIPKRASPVVVIALGLLAGGALGNLYDRLEIGGVRDFIKAYHWGYVWPNFNLADSAICTGVGMLFIREFVLHLRSKQKSDGDSTSSADEPAGPTEEAKGVEGTPAA